MTFSLRAISALVVSACLSTTVAAQGPPIFPPTPVNYGVGVLPHSVAIGDLNHDGYPDLVTASDEQFTPVPIPKYPLLVGKSFYFQSFWVEPASQQCTPGFSGLESSRGLAVTIQP